MVNFLFRKVVKDTQHDYKILGSYIQIYNEKVYDLLVNDAKTGSLDAELTLRESSEKGVHLEGLSEYVVQSPKEVFELLKLGRSRLIVSLSSMVAVLHFV